jgi:hypothetical protein
MVRLVAAGILALTCAFAPAAVPASADDAREEAVVALARLYGVVRYFHPSEVVARMPWDRFLLEATARAETVERREDIGPWLGEAFAIVSPGVEISREDFAPERQTEARLTVRWRHAGLGIDQATDLYRSWRVGVDRSPPLGGRLTVFAGRASAIGRRPSGRWMEGKSSAVPRER